MAYLFKKPNFLSFSPENTGSSRLSDRRNENVILKFCRICAILKIIAGAGYRQRALAHLNVTLRIRLSLHTLQQMTKCFASAVCRSARSEHR